MSTPDESSADDVALGLLQDLMSETAGEEQSIRNPIPPLDLIVDLSWRAVGRSRDFRALPRGATMAVIVQVPSDSWIDPVHAFVHENDPGVMIVDGKTNKKSWIAQEALIVDALDRGKTVCGIASDPDTQLPPLLRGAADLVLTVPAPTPELMRRAIRRHTGRSAPALTALDIGGLDLMDLAAALRPGTTPKACVKRLRVASASRSVSTSHDATPLLQDLSGYGEARDWCLATFADIEAVRAGTLSPGELESAIFYGPPGTGKTTLARSLAKTSRLPLIQTSVADWFQKNSGHLGDVLQCVNDVFARARSSAPCILFIDELDSLPNRATMDNRGRDWWQSVINSMLMNTAEVRESRKGIILLAATNHLEHIDAALLRPGRIDRRFRIGPPDAAGLAGILRSHLGSDCPAADLMALARLMPGRTGADVAGFVREARRLARSAGRPLAEADLRAAIMPVDPRPPQELRHVAIHEAGHAVIARRLGFRVDSVTIRAVGPAGGWTGIVLPSVSDRMRIEARVQLLLAGRAANEIFGAAADTGASSDLAEATRLLAAARTSFGLAGQLVVRAPADDALALVARDPALAEAVNGEMARLMKATRQMVGESRNDIQRVADTLVDRGALDAHELEGLLSSASSERRSRPAHASPGRSFDGG